MSVWQQLEGNIKFGTTAANTSFSAEITSLKVVRARNLVEVPATFFNAEPDQVAGTTSNMLEITFLGDPSAASTFWSMLYDAVDADLAELYWAATLASSVTVSATNPKFSGVAVIAGLETGAEVGTVRLQSQVFPIKAGTLAKATTGTI